MVVGGKDVQIQVVPHRPLPLRPREAQPLWQKSISRIGAAGLETPRRILLRGKKRQREGNPHPTHTHTHKRKKNISKRRAKKGSGRKAARSFFPAGHNSPPKGFKGAELGTKPPLCQKDAGLKEREEGNPGTARAPLLHLPAQLSLHPPQTDPHRRARSQQESEPPFAGQAEGQG